MSMYTRLLSSLGQKEARRIELSTRKTISKLLAEIKALKSDNRFLREELKIQEQRHVEDMLSINQKLDILTDEVYKLRMEQINDRELIKKNKAKSEAADQERKMFQGIVEAILLKNPDIKLSDFLHNDAITDDD